MFFYVFHDFITKTFSFLWLYVLFYCLLLHQIFLFYSSFLIPVCSWYIFNFLSESTLNRRTKFKLKVNDSVLKVCSFYWRRNKKKEEERIYVVNFGSISIQWTVQFNCCLSPSSLVHCSIVPLYRRHLNRWSFHLYVMEWYFRMKYCVDKR